MFFIDSREPLEIIEMFKQACFKYEVKALDVGDFIEDSKGIVIERKTTEDFIQSLQSGHLHKQLLQMEQFPHPYLIITGIFQPLDGATYKYYFGMKQYCGALASCYARFPKLRIIQVTNTEQMILFIKSLIEKIDDGKQIDITHTELLKDKLGDGDYKKAILMLFPKIGGIRAKKLLADPDVSAKIDEFLAFCKEKKILK